MFSQTPRVIGRLRHRNCVPCLAQPKHHRDCDRTNHTGSVGAHAVAAFRPESQVFCGKFLLIIGVSTVACNARELELWMVSISCCQAILAASIKKCHVACPNLSVHISC